MNDNLIIWVRLDPPLSPLSAGGPDPLPPTVDDRPAVALVVPFSGSARKGEELQDALRLLERRTGDQIVMVDNSPAATLEPREGIEVVRAADERSSYHARNAGWRHADAAWIAFIDADTRPVPTLLDAFFVPPPGDSAGAVAGAILHPPGASGWAERWTVETDVLGQASSLSERPPYAVTANLLVRRAVLEELGGFAEGVRSTGDAEFSRRLAAAGYEIEYRSRAAVVHSPRPSLRKLLRQYARYGAGNGWLARHSGTRREWLMPAWGLWRDAAEDLAGARVEMAALRATTLLTLAAQDAGAMLANRPPGPPLQRSELTVARTRAPGDPPGTLYADDDAPADVPAALLWLARRPEGRASASA